MTSNPRQSRHPKGSPKGGQWVPSSRAETFKQKALSLDTDVAPPFSAGSTHNKFTLRINTGLQLKQRTVLKDKNGDWQLPLHLSSALSRSIQEKKEIPDYEELLDIGTIVVTDMVSGHCRDIPEEGIDKIMKHGIKGAYGGCFQDNNVRRNPTLEFAHKWKSLYGNPYDVVGIEATLRGMWIGKELDVYRSQEFWLKEQSLHLKYIKKRLQQSLPSLLPICDPPRSYLGDDQKTILRALEMPVPPHKTGRTLADFIIEDCEGMSHQPSFAQSYASLAVYMLGNATPDESAYDFAVSLAESIFSTHPLTMKIEFSRLLRLIDDSKTMGHGEFSNDINIDAYRKVVTNVLRAEGTNSAWLMNHLIQNGYEKL